MDKIVAMIMGLSSNEADLKTLKQNLQKSEEVMYKSQHLDDALSQLDNVLYSMGVTFILYVVPPAPPRRSLTAPRSAKASNARIPEPARFVAQCARFLTDANPDQVRMVASKCTPRAASHVPDSTQSAASPTASSRWPSS